MRNMEKVGIFFSVLLISITLFFVIQTGSTKSQNVPSTPGNQNYPASSTIPITVTETTITNTSQASYVISQSDIDEILRDSYWKSNSMPDGTDYMRIWNSQFEQGIFHVYMEGQFSINNTHIVFYGASWRNEYNITWLSKDSFIEHYRKGWNITYNRESREYPNK